jgi:hypothetical protein
MISFFRTLTRLAVVLCGILGAEMLAAQNAFFPPEVVVTASALKLREQANLQSKVLETLPRGTVMQVTGIHNDGEVVEVDSMYAPWYKVRHNGKVGFVFGGFVTETIGLYYENDIANQPTLPQLNWYGVYMRDSFSDEIRKIEVRYEEEYSEMVDGMIQVLKTNQREESKFIIGTTYKLPLGYVGPLGITDSPGWFFEGGLAPGAMQPISVGQEPGDETIGETYFLAATGCAALKDNFVQVTGYQLQVLEINDTNSRMQNLTPWFLAEIGINPQVQLTWYGDLDQDKKPDAVIHDCPFEMGCRASLFLSSKAQSGEMLRKVCEHFWYGD